MNQKNYYNTLKIADQIDESVEIKDLSLKKRLRLMSALIFSAALTLASTGTFSVIAYVISESLKEKGQSLEDTITGGALVAVPVVIALAIATILQGIFFLGWAKQDRSMVDYLKFLISSGKSKILSRAKKIIKSNPTQTKKIVSYCTTSSGRLDRNKLKKVIYRKIEML